MTKLGKGLATILLLPWVGTALLLNPVQYVHWRDRGKAMTLLLGFPWGEPCVSKRFWREPDGEMTLYLYVDDTPACIRYDPPRRFDGIWWDQFEGEAYWDFASILPMSDGAPDFGGTAWLNIDQRLLAGKDIDRNNGKEKPWHISFIGRQTSVPGFHGHYGQFRHNIIVEHIISIEQMPLPKEYKRRF